MESKHSPPRRRQTAHYRPAEHREGGERRPDPRRARHRRRHGAPPKRRFKAWQGWAALAGALLLLLVVILSLRSCRRTPAAPEPSPAPSGPGSAFDVSATAAPIKTLEGSGGRAVEVGAIQTGFHPPESVTVGVLKSVDLTDLGETVKANAAAAGWGELDYSLGQNGELLLRNSVQIVLDGADFQKQQDFLGSSQPENLARTFLDNSGLIPLLRAHGLTLSLEAENEGGMIRFTGSGDAPGAECSIAFSFLYTGAFNQAILRAVSLEGAVTTDKVLSLRKAAESAVTWSSADSGTITVTDVELRPIRGLPFYVLGGTDGTVAYALAVEDSVLDTVPGAREVYRELMQNGIQEYAEISGAA